MAGPGPVVRRRRLGLELRRLREQAGLTIEQVAAALEVSDSKISRIETAQVGSTPRDVRDMLELYGVSHEQREWLIQISREARQKAWWQRFRDIPETYLEWTGLEAGATSVRQYAALLVPGLLQTRQYAEVVLRTMWPNLPPADIEQQVNLRMGRQHILSSEDPATLRAVIDEAALRRVVGGPDVMRDQLERIAEAAARPNVTIQALPFSAGQHAGLDGSFEILSFAEDAEPEAVYVESATSEPYRRDTDVIRRYVLLYDHVQAAALDPADSEAFLASMVHALP